jgi:flavin-dependent dehydrogenase
VSHTQDFDVIVVCGGIAGSTLAGVLTQSGLEVLVVEKEARFRDRIRGESTWPYGVADALHLGLVDLFARTRSVELVGVKKYDRGDVVRDYRWATDSIAGLSEMGFSHERLQEASFAWAASNVATMMRPAKATKFTRNGRPTVTVAEGGRETEFAARLVVGSDGKQSMAQRWTGGKSVADPSQGHGTGTALLFHDVRALGELLLAEMDWGADIAAYADRRSRYFDAVLQYDRWQCTLSAGQGAEADRLREGHERANGQDPSLGGFALIEARGPDGLVANSVARRMHFGEHLA